MAIYTIHSFLVAPSKQAAKPPKIGGAKLRLNGKLYDMLAGVYDNKLIGKLGSSAVCPDAGGGSSQ